MTIEVDTPFGSALPPFPTHAITVHMPTWAALLQFIEDPQALVSRMKSIYPRFGPFGPVRELIGRIAADYLNEGQACLIFSSRDSAEACRDFLLSDKRQDPKVDSARVEMRVLQASVQIWVTAFPASNMPAAVPYWQDCGTGISPRLAQELLDHIDSLKEIKLEDAVPGGLPDNTSAYSAVKNRIASQLNRSTIDNWPHKVKASDVYLYPTGMAAIYQLHRSLQKPSVASGSTVQFGYAFHSTPEVFKEYSESFRWFGKGDDEEVKQLEQFCKDEKNAGRQVQAVWLEFPSNPNLRSSNLKGLRALADEFGFILGIDDTISSFCNVDLLGSADVLWTSLTKSFSGYADVMGGSVTLNPNSKHYRSLKDIMDGTFVNEYYRGDVDAMERNSRDYIERSKQLNANALAVVQYLEPLVKASSSAVAGVEYPAVGPGEEYYKAVMRRASADFDPGYGCLFSVELESVETTVAFYDHLRVHKGPHLGANLTLALPYVKGILGKAGAWVGESGMNENMIRISVGLEETDDLVQRFRTAVAAADAVKHKNPLDKVVNPLS